MSQRASVGRGKGAVKEARVPCIWPIDAPLTDEAKTTQDLMKAMGHEAALVYSQPIGKEKEQTLLEKLKMDNQKIQDLEKKIRKTKKYPLKFTFAI